MMPDIIEGAAAPDFDLPTDTGSVSLSGLRGRKVVLYFYPKDDTPGCTNEAQQFSAAAEDFAAAGAVVVGVSRDSVKRHRNFRTKYGLKVELGADEDGKVTEAYGVWVEKSLYGRQYMGIERATFLIDGQGVVRKVWRKVKVPGHVQDVLKATQTID
jgi:peroxiredoxin Q/BCP